MNINGKPLDRPSIYYTVEDHYGVGSHAMFSTGTWRSVLNSLVRCACFFRLNVRIPGGDLSISEVYFMFV